MRFPAEQKVCGPLLLCAFARCLMYSLQSLLLTAGVVGCAPLLRPRDCFQYQSWVNLPGNALACYASDASVAAWRQPAANMQPPVSS